MAGARSAAAWLGGVTLALVGSSLEAAGLNGMKHAHTAERRRAPESRRPVLRRPLWWAGFGVFLAGNAMDFVALGLAGQSIVALCGSTSMLTNAAVARWLGEVFTRKDAYGTLLIIVGVAVTVAFSRRTVREYDLDQILARYRQPGPASFLGGVCAAAFVLLAFIWANRTLDPLGHEVAGGEGKEMVRAGGGCKAAGGGEAAAPTIVGAEAGSAVRAGDGGDGGLEEGGHQALPSSGVSLADLSTMLQRSPLERAYHLAHPALGALIAAIALNIGKAVSELLVTTVQGDNQLDKPLLYVLVAAFVCCLVSQLHFIDRSLRINDALLHVPVFYVLWNLLAMVGGGVVFEEFADFRASDYALFSLGAGILFLGVYCCASHA